MERFLSIVDRLRAAGCVFAEDEERVLSASASDAAELGRMVDRRCAGEPLESVVGWASFCGLRITIDPGVFVPRARSELLAREAVRAAFPGAVVLDLCCGSGAIGAVVASAVPDASVYAADIDPAAVRCARRNLPADRVFEGDLLDALPLWLRGQLDVLVVNAPYVPTAEIAFLPAEARLHEARVALDGGDDGTAVHRRVAAAAGPWLAPGGRLLIETGTHQADLTGAALTAAGFDVTIVHDADLAATVVGAVAMSGRA